MLPQPWRKTVPVASIKGTVSRDFLLLVFFMNQFPPSPWVYHYGRFKFFRKFAEIFAAQGWLTTGINNTGGKFATGVNDAGGKIAGHSGAGGKLIDEKNQKQKISWHCPFNRVQALLARQRFFAPPVQDYTHTLVCLYNIQNVRIVLVILPRL